MITASFVVQLVTALWLVVFTSFMDASKASAINKIFFKALPIIFAFALTLSAFKVF